MQFLIFKISDIIEKNGCEVFCFIFVPLPINLAGKIDFKHGICIWKP